LNRTRTVRQAIPYLVDERGQAIRLLLKKGGSYQRIGDMKRPLHVGPVVEK